MADEKELKEFLEYWETPKTTDDHKRLSKEIDRAVKDAKKYVNDRYGDNIPDINTILKEYYAIFEKSDATTTSLSNMYLLRTMREFLANPSMLFKTYEEEKDTKRFWDKRREVQYKYTSSAKNNRRIFAHDIFHNFTDYQGRDFSREKILEASGEERKKILEDLVAKVRITNKNLSEKFTDSYINALISTLKILDKLGALEQNLRENNRDRVAMGLDLLTFSEVEPQSSIKYSVSELFEPEFLRKLPLEKLVLIHGFYTNRLKKVADKFGMGLFICSKTGDFDKNNKDVNLEEMITAYLQYNALDKIYQKAVPCVYADLEKYKHENEYQGERYVLASSDKIYSDFFEKYEGAYFIYSGSLAKEDSKKSNMSSDFDIYFYTQVMDYFQKNASIETILVTAIESFDKVNWGYIPEIKDGKNSIQRKRENILLGFDIEGLNMPVRLHMPIDKVRSFFKNFNKNYEIPNYIGNEDFEVLDFDEENNNEKTNKGTSILMPLSPKQRKAFIKFVKDEMSPKSEYYHFARHIQCMQYDNNLIRLNRWKDPNGRNGERVYTNLLTGEEVTLARQK